MRSASRCWSSAAPPLHRCSATKTRENLDAHPTLRPALYVVSLPQQHRPVAQECSRRGHLGRTRPPTHLRGHLASGSPRPSPSRWQVRGPKRQLAATHHMWLRSRTRTEMAAQIEEVLLARRIGDTPVKCVAIVGGTHGNERHGVHMVLSSVCVCVCVSGCVCV